MATPNAFTGSFRKEQGTTVNLGRRATSSNPDRELADVNVPASAQTSDISSWIVVASSDSPSGDQDNAYDVTQPVTGVNPIIKPESETNLAAPFKVRPSSFFKVGKVFLTLWTEPHPGTVSASDHESMDFSQSLFPVAFREMAFSKVRRFVVVREGSSSCLCHAISTHSGQGVRKPGLDLREHAIVYTGRTQPGLNNARDLGLLPSIRVDPDHRDTPLRESSLLDFGRIFTIEHSIKVKPFGVVNQQSTNDLLRNSRMILQSDKNKALVDTTAAIIHGLETMRTVFDSTKDLRAVPASLEKLRKHLPLMLHVFSGLQDVYRSVSMEWSAPVQQSLDDCLRCIERLNPEIKRLVNVVSPFHAFRYMRSSQASRKIEAATAEILSHLQILNTLQHHASLYAANKATNNLAKLDQSIQEVRGHQSSSQNQASDNEAYNDLIQEASDSGQALKLRSFLNDLDQHHKPQDQTGRISSSANPASAATGDTVATGAAGLDFLALSSDKRAAGSEVRPRAFYEVGRVFLTQCLQFRCNTDQPFKYALLASSEFESRDEAEADLQMFVVIREGKHSCSGLLITHYDNKGVAEPGIIKSEHGIIYSSLVTQNAAPDETPGSSEEGMQPIPIKLDLDDTANSLNPMARINFAEVHTFQHSIKSKAVGKVAAASIEDLRNQFFNVWFSGGAKDEVGTTTPVNSHKGSEKTQVQAGRGRPQSDTPRTYVCDYTGCAKSFGRLDNLRRHQKSAHGGSKSSSATGSKDGKSVVESRSMVLQPEISFSGVGVSIGGFEYSKSSSVTENKDGKSVVESRSVLFQSEISSPGGRISIGYERSKSSSVKGSKG